MTKCASCSKKFNKKKNHREGNYCTDCVLTINQTILYRNKLKFLQRAKKNKDKIIAGLREMEIKMSARGVDIKKEIEASEAFESGILEIYNLSK
jgi:DNA-directed RNA polymerase subunit RPC12/RpoP